MHRQADNNALESKKKTRVVIAFALPTLARFSRFTAVTLMLLRRPHSASRDSVTLIRVADIVVRDHDTEWAPRREPKFYTLGLRL